MVNFLEILWHGFYIILCVHNKLYIHNDNFDSIQIT